MGHVKRLLEQYRQNQRRTWEAANNAGASPPAPPIQWWKSPSASPAQWNTERALTLVLLLRLLAVMCVALGILSAAQTSETTIALTSLVAGLAAGGVFAFLGHALRGLVAIYASLNDESASKSGSAAGRDVPAGG